MSTHDRPTPREESKKQRQAKIHKVRNTLASFLFSFDGKDCRYGNVEISAAPSTRTRREKIQTDTIFKRSRDPRLVRAGSPASKGLNSSLVDPMRLVATTLSSLNQVPQATNFPDLWRSRMCLNSSRKAGGRWRLEGNARPVCGGLGWLFVFFFPFPLPNDAYTTLSARATNNPFF